MLSSVSYVCLGVRAGMWVISMGMYLSALGFSFILVLLLQRRVILSVFAFLGCVYVLFAFISQMFSALLCGRISGPRFPRDPVLHKPLQVLFRML